MKAVRILPLLFLLFIDFPVAVFAASKMGDLSALLNDDGEYGFLVEFEINSLKKNNQGQREARGLLFNDTRIRSATAKQLKNLKHTVLSAFQSTDVTVVHQYEHLPLLHVKTKSAAVVQALQRNPRVVAIHENSKLRLVLSESLPLIQQDKALSLGAGGQGTSVAILDTGVDYTQSAFGSCTAPGEPSSCRVVYSADTALNDQMLDAHGHGTNVAGIAAGIAPASSIVAFDVFQGSLAYTSDIIEAISDAIALRDTYNIVAINMSLGGGLYQDPCTGNPFQASIESARSNGILTVAASGNDAASNKISIPACTPGVVSVGAVYDANVGGLTWGGGTCTDSSTFADKITCFSNSAYFLTMLAPGALTTAAGITMGGTSQATPHVSGAVAVLRAAFPSDTLDETVNRLTSSGVPITDSRNGVTVPRLDVIAAVGAINDQIADAVSVNGQSGSSYGNNTGTSLESGESTKAGNAGGRSVWWDWQAPLSGPVSWDTAGSTFNTLLAAYEGGSMPALLSVAENDDAAGITTSKVTFTATAGTTYAIAVDGKDAAFGTIVINWEYPDTDSDTVIDALDNCPNDANTNQSNIDGDMLGDVCDSDVDGDGLLNIDEPTYGTDPLVKDTDGDTLLDGDEVFINGTDPYIYDTDSDGLSDGDEVITHGTDPNVSNVGDVGPRWSPDNQLNAADLVVMSRLVTGVITATPMSLEFILADINNDNQIDVADLLLLQQAILSGTAP